MSLFLSRRWYYSPLLCNKAEEHRWCVCNVYVACRVWSRLTRPEPPWTWHTHTTNSSHFLSHAHSLLRWEKMIAGNSLRKARSSSEVLKRDRDQECVVWCGVLCVVWWGVCGVLGVVCVVLCIVWCILTKGEAAGTFLSFTQIVIHTHALFAGESAEASPVGALPLGLTHSWGRDRHTPLEWGLTVNRTLH